MKKIRTRFAPSPTGALHIGGVRTALYNYLFAKQNGGEVILRIEDTDQKRFVDKSEEYINEAFKWFGLEFDESPSNPNPKYGNYRQSEREYKQYVDILLANDNAYYAFDTSEDLSLMRDNYKKMKKVFSYNYLTRGLMKNSVSLPSDEVKRRLDNGDPYTIRFKMPRNRDVIINDLVRGNVKFNTNTLDDKVLMKETGIPTYHMANVVDDHLMEISHVIRGEEWLPSAALHTLLYEALGWEVPKFAHLNLILNPDGKGKLSKRSAIKKGFSVFPLTADTEIDGVQYTMEGYKEKGYQPAAVLNFLALLGWSPKNDKEILSIEDMIKEFDINNLSKGGARFDLDKLDWFSSKYIDMIPASDFIVTDKYDSDKIEMIGDACKERSKFLPDLGIIRDLFLYDITEYSDLSKITEDFKLILNIFINNIEKVSFNDTGDIKNFIYNLTVSKSIKFGKIMPGLRQALLGGTSGPDLMTTMVILGKEETVKRINKVING